VAVRRRCHGHEAIIKLLLETGKVDADSKDSDGQTPLSRAAEHGHKAVVKLLLMKGVEMRIENRGGWTALQLAALNRHEGVELLLETYGLLQPEDFYGLQQLFLEE
jgi:ankyrin repeat protein